MSEPATTMTIKTGQELKYLARCAELLREQTEMSCEAKMESFV